ncbi:MAG: glycoside hydrolase family 6 protein [Spirochaetales bacterium]|nr:glycoside hydrolase family 6 protein [Spirochaetales bacterium]
MLKKQKVLCKGFLLVLVFLCCSIMATYGQELGDANNDGSISIIDALLVAQEYVGLGPSPFYPDAADVDCNGSIDILDALLIAQYYVGLINEFPCGSTATPGTSTATPITSTTTPTPITSTATPPPTEQRVDNPWAGSTWYHDPIWGQKARDGGGASIANNNTCVWMDRIGAITDGIGLRGHLDECLSQGANLIMIAVYNAPNRDCSASASNGELLIAEDGFNRYCNEYIDPIVAIMGDSAYRGLRIVCILEQDSLANLITNLDIAKCSEANGAGGYVDCIRYATNQLRTLPNTYIYGSLEHSGWLGWSDNFGPFADLCRNVWQNTNDGFNSVAGFVTNPCNYTPTEEPYLTNPDLQVGGQAVKSATFYEWNPYFDELKFGRAMINELKNRGFPSRLNFCVDTSRNGWGGSGRPTRVSSSSDLNTYVNESRVDRRLHRGNWCNQRGGIGYRPQANPTSGVSAYIWVKPPGESDGISQEGTVDPNDPAKKFDQMCGPNGTNPWGNCGTGAMDGAPHAGRWFQAQFDVLLQNAYPSL